MILGPFVSGVSSGVFNAGAGTGGGAVPAELALQVYKLADVVATGDPLGILASVAAVGNDLEATQMTIENPSTASFPNASGIRGAYREWELKDFAGSVGYFRPEDLARILLYCQAWPLAVDNYIACAITAGGVASVDNLGHVFGVRYSAAGPEVFCARNPGTGWTSTGVGAAKDKLTRCVIGQWQMGNSASNVRFNAVPADAYGVSSTLGNTGVAPTTGNETAAWWEGNGYNRIALVTGWTTGVGGPTSTTITASPRSVFGRFRQLVAFRPRINAVATPPPTLPRRILIIGDSNGNGTQVDATYGGGVIAVTHPDWTVRDAGVNLTQWPATNTPGTGVMPYLLDELIAMGVTTGDRWIIRRASNGLDSVWPGAIRGLVEGAVEDVIALNLGDPELICVVMGANDSQNVVESTRFVENFRRVLEILRDRYEHARIIAIKEHTLDTVTVYPELLTNVHSAIDAVVSAVSGAQSLTGPTGPMADNIHWSSTGTTSGQDALAALIAGAL